MTPCLHPITFDEQRDHFGREGGEWWRVCALCSLAYDRTLAILAPLAVQCMTAWRVDFGRVSRAVRDEGEWRGEEFVP